MRLFIQKMPKRKMVYALSDMSLDGNPRVVRMSDAEFSEYQQAKAIYEKWQTRFAHVQRYGW